MISGHTHKPLCIPELRILNTGDWMDSRSFILQKKRRFYGVQVHSNRELVEIFHLDYRPKKVKPPVEEEQPLLLVP